MRVIWLLLMALLVVTLGLLEGARDPQPDSSKEGVTDTQLDSSKYDVCPQGPPVCRYAKIQEAIDAAMEGSVISVAPGTYQENLNITKSLVLRGARREQVTLKAASDQQPAITIRDAQVTLAGFTIQGGYLSNIEVSGLAQARILQNSFKEIWVGDEAQAIIQGNDIINKDILDLSIGISIFGQAVIIDNQISGHRIGILGGQAIIKGNRVFKNTIGIEVTDAAELQDNLIFDNEAGVTVGFDNSLLVMINNEVFNNRDGIVLLWRTSAYFADNKVVSNKRWGFALLNRRCGDFPWYLIKPLKDTEPKDVIVNGDFNKVQDNGQGDFCPPYPGPPWPEGLK